MFDLFKKKKIEEDSKKTEEIYKRLIDIGYFDFEKAEAMLTPDFFPTMKKIKMREIISILKELSDMEQTSDVKVLQNRILTCMNAIAFWIDEKNLLSFIRNKN